MIRDLLMALILIHAALIFYIINLVVSWEKIKPRSGIILLLALIADIWGTVIMYQLRDGFSWEFHTMTGLTALLGMIILFIVSFMPGRVNHVNWSKAYKFFFAVWLISYITAILGF